MNKESILEQLRAAKAAHISWVQRAKLLIEGFEIDKNSIPVNSTECKFGKWYYGEAQRLNALRNNDLECMSSIEELHFRLHDIYMKIFKLYYQTDNRGFFSKLFGRKKRLSEETVALGRNYYTEMEDVSRQLVAEINRLERRIIAIPQEEIENI